MGCVAYEVPPDFRSAGSTPIGRPIWNTRIYILDGDGEPVPIGVAGELHIGGAQVARGYLHQPELTAQRFIASPFVAGDRLYKTGDLARYLADGTIEYLGRNDFQVKIRGYRIELGEIEARLRDHASVREAVVLAREDAPGEKRLVAYYTAREAVEASAEDLRSHLLELLPEYMVPAAYVHLESMPLTPNGKLDRNALPAPDDSAHIARQYEPPLGAVEETIARIWSEVLGVERIGRHDNFFALGGHSLLAVRFFRGCVRPRSHTDISTLFSASTLSSLAGAVGGPSDTVEVVPNRIPPGSTTITPDMLPLVQLSEVEISRIVATVPGGAANVQDIYPLAPLQEGILFHHLLAREGDPYLQRSVQRFANRARLDEFIGALQSVIDRHDIMRTAFVWEGLPEPVQVVWRKAQLVIEEVQCDASGGEVVDQLKALFDPRLHRLDLHQAPLFRVAVAQDAKTGRWVMILLFHHLVSDRVALDFVFDEIRAHLLKSDEELAEPVPFRNFVAQARLGVSRAEHESFFREMLGDVGEPTAAFGLVDVQGDSSPIALRDRPLDAALSQRLRGHARMLGVSTASLFHVAWARVLGALSGRDDVVFGTVLFGRMQGGDGADRTLGLLINTLPVRIRVSDQGVRESVRTTHSALAKLMRHEHASLALAQRCSAVAAPTPLFSTLLNYRHIRTLASRTEAQKAWEGIEFLGGEGRTNYPLTLSVNDFGEALSLVAQVVSPIDPASICDSMHATLERLADALDRTPRLAIGELSVLSARERQRIVVDWNATEAYATDRCLHELFEERVAIAPDAVAVEYEDAQLTYGELNARANRLARHLRGLGVVPDSRVALCVERSLEMVVGLLAVLKAGGACVPLDPSYPVDRLRYMLEDGAPVAVLTHDAVSETVRGLLSASGVAVIDVERDASRWSDESGSDVERSGLLPEHLAYVIYTSGTTGRPKGVMLEHKGTVNALAWAQAKYAPASDDRMLQKTPVSFDVAIWEMFWPLLGGATLVVARPDGHKDPEYLLDVIRSERITSVHFVPSMLQLLLDDDDAQLCVGLRRVICSGEALPGSLARRFRAQFPDVELYNEYGPTEAAVVTAWDCNEHLPENIPIGHPIQNMRAYILDDLREPVPIGVVGEVYAGGVQVARGYLNQPELTAERFIASPFVAGDRLYKTGDLARYLADGTIEYLGRNDFQVKIRGFRIELGEIEARLRDHEIVREAVVLAREDGSGEKRLVAYYTAREAGDASAEELRSHLLASLPEYMVPAAYVHLEAMPLTPNGKLDRKALPAPDGSAYSVRRYEAPSDDVEEAVACIWRDVLKVGDIGRHDNFFELGGHSLLAVRVLSRLRRELNVELTLRAVFAAPVLRDLAQVIRGATASTLLPIARVDRDAPLRLSFAQQRLWFLAQMQGVSEAYHISLGQRLHGRLDRAALREALDALVSRHESLRTTFTTVDGEPVQRIAPEDSGFRLLEHDLRTDARQAEELAKLQREEAATAFDLEAGPIDPWPADRAGRQRARLADDDASHHLGRLVDGDPAERAERAVPRLPRKRAGDSAGLGGPIR